MGKQARLGTAPLTTSGIVSVFSLPELPWSVAIVGLWLAGLLAIHVWRRRLREVPRTVRRELPALGVGVAVLVAVLLPQAQRMWDFLATREGTGITDDNIGNLVGRLPGWEAGTARTSACMGQRRSLAARGTGS